MVFGIRKSTVGTSLAKNNSRPGRSLPKGKVDDILISHGKCTWKPV